MYIYKNNINIYIRVLYSFDLISRQTLLGLAPDQTWFSPVASAANRRQHCEEQACELHQKYRITHCSEQLRASPSGEWKRYPMEVE